MPKPPALHAYSDRAAFDRLILLISAIAQNPGIGAPNAGVDAMGQILGAMQAIDPECPDWALATLRKDIRFLIDRGILPTDGKRKQGYRISYPAPLMPVPKQSSGRRKSRLCDGEIKALHEQGMSYAQIAERAGISRARVGQIVTGR